MNPLPEPVASLEKRMGRPALEKRLRRQADHWAQRSHQGEGIFCLEMVLPLDAIAAFLLRVSGLAKRAHANFLAPQIIERQWRLPRLPPILLRV